MISQKKNKGNIFQDLEELTNKFPEILKIFETLLDISLDNPRDQTHQGFKHSAVPQPPSPSSEAPLYLESPRPSSMISL